MHKQLRNRCDQPSEDPGQLTLGMGMELGVGLRQSLLLLGRI